jgi:hypothetical protein
MSVTYCPCVGWGTVLAYWTTDTGEDGIDISASGGSGAVDLDSSAAVVMGYTALAAALAQLHIVGVANAIQGEEATPVNFPIPVVAATMGHTVAAPAQVQQYTLLIAVPATLGGSATSSVIGLNVGLAVMGHTVAAPTQLQAFPINPAVATQGHTVAAPGQTQLHILPVAGASMGSAAGRID